MDRKDSMRRMLTADQRVCGEGGISLRRRLDAGKCSELGFWNREDIPDAHCDVLTKEEKR